MGLLLCGSALAADIPQDYSQVAQNTQWTLYMKESTLSLIIESNTTGSLLYSTVMDAEKHKDNATWKNFYQSGIVMEYIEDVKSQATQAGFVGDANEKAFTYLDNGFIVTVRFTNLGISYTATITLQDWGIDVSIPQSGIVEENPAKYTTAGFYVYPFMGYSYLGQDEGYLLIPDGQGAIIPLQDNEARYTSPFSSTVYGMNFGLEEYVYVDLIVDPEQVKMPVFGIAHTDKGIAWLGVIENGDSSAKIWAYPNGVRMNFDWVCAQYIYRVVYPQPTGPSSGAVSMRTEHAKAFDIKQRFLLTQDAEANYAGMAKAYREYLKETGAFANADPIDTFDVEITLLGGEKKNWVIGKTDVPMTTFEQAGDILEALYNQGVSNISAVYRGWLKDGLTGGIPTTGYNPSGTLGGKKALESLMEKAPQWGTKLYLDVDFLNINVQVNPTLQYSAMKRVNSATFRIPTFGYVWDGKYFLTPAKSVEMAGNVLPQLQKTPLYGVRMTGITEAMSDYHYQNKYYDSSAMMAQYEEIAKLYADAMPTLLAAPNQYLWKYASRLTNLPIGGSSYQYVSQEVPFMAISLSGQVPFYTEYTNFQANTRRFFLKLVEQGARPSFLLTWEDPIELKDTDSSGIYSSRFSLYENMIVSWYHELSELHAKIGGTAINSHTRADDIIQVTYENGLTIYINLNEVPKTVNGIALDALGYKAVTP